MILNYTPGQYAEHLGLSLRCAEVGVQQCKQEVVAS